MPTESLFPIIVYVFPEAVCPYAKMVPKKDDYILPITYRIHYKQGLNKVSKLTIITLHSWLYNWNSYTFI